MAGMHERLDALVVVILTHSIGGALTGLLTLSFLFFFTAVVPSIALAQLLCLKVSMIFIASLELIETLLELAKVKLQIFVDFAHLQILFFEVLPALIC